MSTQQQLFRPSRRLGAVAFAAAAALGGSLVTPTLAQEVAPAAQDPQCAEAYPVDELVKDMPVTGMTVSSGTTPDPFTGTVLGVVQDGIAPGVDMIMVRLTSPEIDRVGGIWSGMSGSPVYAADGRLIGAVAYGLSFGPSTVAGVTPAAAMQALLDGGTTATGGTTEDRIAVPERAAERIVAKGYATKAEVESGFSRLPLAFGVSGMANAKRLRQFAEQFGLENVRIYNTGGTSVDEPAAEIVAGGNLAVTLSYGDLTAGGVGTATQVCADEVIGFGHPAYWTGPTTLTLHGADALFVQEDPTLVPFKVANITGPAGTIVDDRLAGIHGYAGVLPGTTVVTSHVTSSEGSSRDGTSYTSVEDMIAEVAAFHLLANLDRVFDGLGAGSSRVRMTVEGLREDGTPFEFARVDRYASGFDLTYESIFDSYEQVSAILDNRFEDVTITDVDFRAFVDRDHREYRVGTVKMLVDGKWVKLDTDKQLKVKPGRLLKLRVGLVSTTADPAKSVDLSVRIPRGTAGQRGSLSLVGGGSIWRTGGGGNSFDQLLENLEGAAHNDDLIRTLRISRPGKDLVSTQSTRINDVLYRSVRIGIRVVS
jgi:hypothetical protein